MTMRAVDARDVLDRRAQDILDGLAEMLRASRAPILRIRLRQDLYLILLRHFAGGRWLDTFGLTTKDGTSIEVRPRAVGISEAFDPDRVGRLASSAPNLPTPSAPAIEGTDESIPYWRGRC